MDVVNAVIPLSVPDLRGREREYLERCIDDNWVSSAGPFVREFEAGLAAVTERQCAVATVNGTTAIQLALTSLGVGVGDLVIVPDWTFVASVNAIYHCGATPFFVDVHPEHWSLDPTLLKRAFNDGGARIKAVICVDTLGHPAAFDHIERICADFGVPLVEDAAGALGSAGFGRPAGNFGALSCFSFNGNKLVTAGGGGMLVTNDPGLATRARHLSTQARVGDDYLHDDIGYNFRMTNVNAAIGLAQLERLDEMVAAKREIAARYDAGLAGLNVELMPRLPWAKSNCWLYSVLLPSERLAQSLTSHLGAQNIQSRIFWRSLSSQAPYAEVPKVQSGVSKVLSGRVVSLPCSSHLTPAEQDRVIGAVTLWYGQEAAQ